MREYNSQSFTKEQVEVGLHLDLINYLLSYNKNSTDSYADIHVWSDSFCLTVDWVIVNYEDAGVGRFEFVGSDQMIMTEYFFPDNHSELCYDEDDYNARLTDWLKENEDFYKDEDGIIRQHYPDFSDFYTGHSSKNECALEEDDETFHENGIPQ